MAGDTRTTDARDKGPSPRPMVPLRPGLFRLPEGPGEKACLVGSRCPDCDSYFYPRRAICLNCGRQGLDDTTLSDRGKVWTYTIARQTPPGSLIEAPYAIAQVQLPEKVMVQTVLTGCDPESVRIGLDVEMVIEKVKEDADGNDVCAFKFRPVST
jgi:uncharacterized OB-fold protein